MQFAGLDTVASTLSTSISYFSRGDNLKYLSYILDNYGPGVGIEGYEGDENFDVIFLEILRLFAPAFTSTWRAFNHNCTIGGFKYRKGDNIGIACAVKYHADFLFKDPSKFDSSRFKKGSGKSENGNSGVRDKVDYAPFGLGRRNCIG